MMLVRVAMFTWQHYQSTEALSVPHSCCDASPRFMLSVNHFRSVVGLL